MEPENFWMGGMWMFPIIFILALLVIGYIIFSRAGGRTPICGRGHDLETHETAMDILKKRYAKGEISKEEFEQMKKDIL